MLFIPSYRSKFHLIFFFSLNNFLYCLFKGSPSNKFSLLSHMPKNHLKNVFASF